MRGICSPQEPLIEPASRQQSGLPGFTVVYTRLLGQLLERDDLASYYMPLY